MEVDRLLEVTSLELIRLGSHQSVCDVIERAWYPSFCSVRLVVSVGTFTLSICHSEVEISTPKVTLHLRAFYSSRSLMHLSRLSTRELVRKEGSSKPIELPLDPPLARHPYPLNLGAVNIGHRAV